jgi:chemotaxis protein methyltransferase CheR
MIKVETPVILPQIGALSQLIGERIGLDFPRRKWDMLQRVVDDLAADNNCPDAGQFLKELLDSPLSESHLNELIVRLTIGETYFLRDKEVFTVLRNHILPDLIARRASEKRLEIWCAASSTGEEPYSIAMLLDEKAAQLKDWQINIQASDLNPDVLEIAQKGVYSNWSLRATPADKKSRYFTQIDKNRFVLAPHLCQMVDFSQLNLANRDFVIPGFGGHLADIIFCRNVLIYFSTELKAQVIKRLTALLQPGGWLFVAPSELGVVNEAELTPVNFPGVIVHQKKVVQDSAAKSGPSNVNRGVNVARKYADICRETKYKLPAGKSVENRVSAAEQRSNNASLPKFDLFKYDLNQDKSTVSQSVSADLLRQAKALFADRSYREVIDLIPEDFVTAGRPVPEFSEIMACKAQALANSGEIQAAAATIALALNADKINPYYCYLSATIKRELGDFDAALDFYRQALFLDPDFIMAHFSIATLLKQLCRKGADRHLRNVENLLENLDADAGLPYNEGLTAGRLLEISRSLSRQLIKS